MPGIKITITNIQQIKAAFDIAPVEMTRELNKAIQQSIFSITRDSKINTPVDTGRLRASHQTLFGLLKGEVGTHVNYDFYVHYGTRYMKARPFLLQAVKSNETKIDKFFTDAVQKVLDEIGRRA